MIGIVRTLALGIVVFAIGAVVTYQLAITLSPARTTSGHPVMPIGHVFLALVVATLGSIAAMVLDRLAQRRRRRRELAALERGELPTRL